jgi:hypothetical protein
MRTACQVSKLAGIELVGISATTSQGASHERVVKGDATKIQTYLVQPQSCAIAGSQLGDNTQPICRARYPDFYAVECDTGRTAAGRKDADSKAITRAYLRNRVASLIGHPNIGAVKSNPLGVCVIT